MVEYLLTIAVFFVIIYALFKGCTVNININFKQEFSESDRQLLEDLYNQDGDPKDKREVTMLEALDDAVRSINDIMLDNREE